MLASCVIFTATAVVALVAAEYRGSFRGIAVAKPAASTGFIATALFTGALDSDYGVLIFAGLALSWVGDVALIPRDSEPAFQIGVLSFLLGHLAYAWAFASIGLDIGAVVTAAVILAAPAVIVLRWLAPHVPGELRIPVRAYILVISIMMATAVGSAIATRNPWIAVGAGAFYLSDLAVARDRFVAAGFANTVWGLPLYYAAQLVLALTPTWLAGSAIGS